MSLTNVNDRDETDPLFQSLLARFSQLIRQGRWLPNSSIVRGCLLGILFACAYNLLFINGEIAKLAEHSMSEEKDIYGIKLFATRVILGAVVGSVAGGLAAAIKARFIRMRRSDPHIQHSPMHGIVRRGKLGNPKSQ